MSWRLKRLRLRWPGRWRRGATTGAPLPDPSWPGRRWPRVLWPRWRWPSRRAHRPLAAVLTLLLLALLWTMRESPPSRPVWKRSEILAAIRYVESGDRDDVPDGDGGLAIGPFQIHEVYWRDAIASDPSLGGTYQDCRRRAYAERVFAAYMAKWCNDAWQNGDAEIVARVHNGGPGGADKAATLGYWQRVRARLPN